MKPIYLYAAKRTPIGSFQGSLSALTAPQLGAAAAKAALQQSKVDLNAFDECVMGNVLSAGVGQAPARQAAIYAGLPKSVRALTVNKVCGSGLKAVTIAAERIQLGRAKWILAGGMESMTNAPYYLPTARSGFRMGNATAIDGMIHDGLWDPYNNFHMGNAGELCAREYKFTREAQDEFAAQSYRKALKAIESGVFKDEISAVEIASKKETLKVETDEEPGRGKIDQFSKLRPAFDKEGTITAANASSINDGASALVVGEESSAHTPLARLHHWAEFAHSPEWFTTAPVGSIKKLLQEASLSVSDIDVFEINEAFSIVAMAAAKDLNIPAEKLNPRGGAVALGHPIGASGARLLTTIIHTLKPKQKGIVSLCIGGGEAIAALVERL